MASKKRFTIFSGTNSALTSGNSSALSQGDFIITEVSGWDAMPGLERNTSSILYSDITAVSKNATYKPRTVEVTLNVSGSNAFMISTKTKIQAMLAEPNQQRSLVLVYLSESGAELQRETLRALIASEGFSWEEKNGNATFILKFIAPNPRKILTKNGQNAGEIL